MAMTKTEKLKMYAEKLNDAASMIADVRDFIVPLADSERRKHDRRSRAWRDSDEGQDSEHWVGLLESVARAIDIQIETHKRQTQLTVSSAIQPRNA